MSEFIAFPKIARLSRDIVVTEKIDGENMAITIVEVNGENVIESVQSRNRFLTLGNDQHGFAKWVSEHAAELVKLGPGQHFGEWWGSGIRRGYGLQKGEKRFSLFNTHRWGVFESRPACCDAVPVLYQGIFDMTEIEYSLGFLNRCGSLAAPGFMRPEGIVIFHTAANLYFKKTLVGDDKPKSVSGE